MASSSDDRTIVTGRPPFAADGRELGRQTHPSRNPSLSLAGTSQRSAHNNGTLRGVHSPPVSRDASPTRRTSSSSTKQSHQPHTKGLTSSPNRSAKLVTATPSAAAVQRALSAADLDPLQISSPGITQKMLLSHQRCEAIHSGSGPSQAPSSPKLKPPSALTASRRNSPGSAIQSDSESIESSHTSLEAPLSSDINAKTGLSNLGQVNSFVAQKLPRGAGGASSKLETVEEADQATSPIDDGLPISESNSSIPESQTYQSGEGVEQSKQHRNQAAPDTSSFGPKLGPQASEEGLVPAPNPPAKQKAAAAVIPTKVRANNDGSAKTMVVETETVSSIPQAALAVNPGEKVLAGKSESNVSLRRKQSGDTIRPRKDRKKATRKPASVISGTGSSKADIFEAKVASEIEGESTDSDETFVYESNPPETSIRRHHSRTPSATSVQSLIERRGGPRPSSQTVDNHRPLKTKRSMKFASTSYASSSVDSESGDRDRGSVRSPNLISVHAGHLQHSKSAAHSHINNAAAAQGENDSPFSQASKMRAVTTVDSKAIFPNPRTPSRLKQPMKKDNSNISDLDGGASDTERTPLIAEMHTSRTRTARRPTGSHSRHVDCYNDSHQARVRNFTGCISMAFALLLISLCGAGFVFVTMTPLYALAVQDIQNVLASEQEIMLDLLVTATNPNIFSISIDTMDVNVFAKSRHIGSDRFWRGGPVSLRSGMRRSSEQSLVSIFPTPRRTRAQLHLFSGGVDEGTDPVHIPESDGQTMLLGRIFRFDSGLTFDSSFLRRQASNSSGEVRLAHPGNKTEVGGTERWGRVIQDPFELIIRGILKYQLPLSTKMHTKSISANVVVHPEDDIDEKGVLRGHRTSTSPFDLPPEDDLPYEFS